MACNIRKRKRRQATALVVQSFLPMGKKSTAQPRPAANVPPRGIGPISEPNHNDVLCGRGGRINAHEGNVQFREIVAAHKKEYLAKTTKKLEKRHVAARIVEIIRTMDPPGRFLKEDGDSGLWFDVGDDKAFKKAGQALREDAPDIRGESEDDDYDDNDAEPVAKKTAVDASPGKEKHSPVNKKSPEATTNEIRVAQPPPRPMTVVSSTTSGESMPATMSVGSAQHSLQGGAVLNPGNIYQGMRSVSNRAAGALSKRATEIMQFQNQQVQAFRQAHNLPLPGFHQGQPHQVPHRQPYSQQVPQARPQGQPPMRYPPWRPEEVAFGRNFTPTELSSGSTMSSISGTSGLSFAGSNATGSRRGGAAPSMLSLGSSGFGLPDHSTHRSGPMSPRVSQMTNSFMSSSGLHRSLSFDDVCSVGATPMSDASFVALLAEDKAIGDILSRMPGSVPGQERSKPSDRNTYVASDTMSLASMGSLSINPVSQPNQHGITKDEMDIMWQDDRSMMSDVSQRIVALDLAL